MFDLRRLGGLMAAASAVALAMLALGGLTLATAGGRPGWLASGDSTIEGGQEAVVGGRIAGVIRQPGDKAPRPRGDLGVLFGSSAVGMGIDPRRLGSQAGPGDPKRWLSLYANGANLEDLDQVGRLVTDGPLRPRLLILGIHPGLLARSDDYLTDRLALDTRPLTQAIAARQPMTAKAELMALSTVPLNWIYPNRTRISNRLRGLASLARRGLFGSLGLGADALFRAEPDPWSVRLLIPDLEEARMVASEGRKATVRDAAEGPMRNALGEVKDKGWGDPTKYSADGPNARGLVDLIRRARGRGTEVVVLILPEAQSLRELIPPEAMQFLHRALDRGFPSDPPKVIDLRDALADSMFHDSIHPNKQGRELLTDRLAEALRGRR
jgi:hypothetical protein